MKKSSAQPKITLEEVQQLIPAANDEEFEALREDIKKRGQLVPIYMNGNTVVDGRARMKICTEEGIEPNVVDISTLPPAANDPTMLALSLNLHRRQLTTAQRALIAAQLAQLKQGANQHRKGASISRQEASSLLAVSADSIDRANKVIHSGNPHLIELTKAGEFSISHASKLAQSHPEVAKLSKDELVKISDSCMKKAERDMHRSKILSERRKSAASLAENNESALVELKGKFSVIYADPPWDYGGSTKDSFCDPSIHYPLMPLEQIKALPVKNCLTDDAALFLWVPNCLIPSGLAVLSAWGFEYVTTMVWCKDNVLNSGGATRAAHETLLIGKKGKALHDPKKACKSWYHEAITVHSRKPKHFAKMIEGLYPGVPKLEMFAREASSKAWSVFGNEVVPDATKLKDKKALPPKLANSKAIKVKDAAVNPPKAKKPVAKSESKSVVKKEVKPALNAAKKPAVKPLPKAAVSPKTKVIKLSSERTKRAA